MAAEFLTYVCRPEAFRPCPADGLTWWGADEWDQARMAHEGMWPDSTSFWTRQEWERLYAQGYRYCALLKGGRAMATAGLWPRTDDQWEVIAVGTAPATRGRGYGKAVVSFVTQTILDAGRDATIGFREANAAMRGVAVALGYEASE
jgi:predicted GNAT family acetyltransferase